MDPIQLLLNTLNELTHLDHDGPTGSGTPDFQLGVPGWTDRRSGDLTQSLPNLLGGRDGDAFFLRGGLVRNEWDNGAKGNVGVLDALGGVFRTAEGTTRYGIDAQVSAADVSTPKDGPVWADVQAFTASASSWAGEDGFSLGASASLIQGAVGVEQSDASSDTDRSARVGAGYGVGAALRGHWGDVDHDGHREFGFGFDFLFLSVDFKTEDPLGDLLRFGGPGGGLLATLLPDTNLTDEVGSGLETAWNEASDWVGNDVGGFFQDVGAALDPTKWF